jgi:hypothetical protein
VSSPVATPQTEDIVQESLAKGKMNLCALFPNISFFCVLFFLSDIFPVVQLKIIF